MVAGEEDHHTFSNINDHSLLHSASSLSHINYSCGSCGYELNLSSGNRNTSIIGSKYGKSMKRGTISFFAIDESRFVQVEELRCRPYYQSRHSWGLFQPRTKLLCRKCETHIGNAYPEDEKKKKKKKKKNCSSQSLSWDGISDNKVYDIKICSLQPSSSMEDVNA